MGHKRHRLRGITRGNGPRARSKDTVSGSSPERGWPDNRGFSEGKSGFCLLQLGAECLLLDTVVLLVPEARTVLTHFGRLAMATKRRKTAGRKKSSKKSARRPAARKKAARKTSRRKSTGR